jgi:hypothetical protein
MCVSYLDYSQIWLNPLEDDHHFSYIILLTIATLAALKKSPNLFLKKKILYFAQDIPKDELQNSNTNE